MPSYYCCPKCNGLLTVKKAFLQHKQSCDGDPEKSPCSFFACAKSEYLKTVSDCKDTKQNLGKATPNTLKEKDSCTTETKKEPAKHLSKISTARVRKNDVKSLPVVVKQEPEGSPIISEERGEHNRPKSSYGTRSKTTKQLKKQSARNDFGTQNVSKTCSLSRKLCNQQPRVQIGKSTTGNYIDIQAKNLAESSIVVVNENGETGAKDADQTSYNIDKLLEELVDGVGDTPVEAECSVPQVDAATAAADEDNNVDDDDDKNYSDVLLNPRKKPLYTTKEYFKVKENNLRAHAQYAVKTVVSGDKGDSVSVIYKCPHCKFQTKFVGFFDRHLRNCHSVEGEWTCKDCGATFAKKTKWRAHKNQHLKPFMCEICSYRCSDSRDLKQHAWKHTGELPFKCTYCNYQTRFRKALTEHKRKHSGDMLKCGIENCTFTTYYKWSLVSHHAAKHQEDKRFMCSDCGYRTSDSGSYTKHTKIHRGRKDFKCSQCNYRGMTRHDVIRHIRRHTKEKVYFCNRCNYSTGYASALKFHMMQHYGVKPFQCSVCGYNSIMRSKVMRHLRQKHQEMEPESHILKLGPKVQIDVKDFRQRDKRGPASETQNILKLEPEHNVVIQEVVEVHVTEGQGSDATASAIQSSELASSLPPGTQVFMNTEGSNFTQVFPIPVQEEPLASILPTVPDVS